MCGSPESLDRPTYLWDYTCKLLYQKQLPMRALKISQYTQNGASAEPAPNNNYFPFEVERNSLDHQESILRRLEGKVYTWPKR